MAEFLKRFFWLWIQCFKSMRNVNTFLPFVIYAALQILVLIMLLNFFHAPFSAFLIPLIKLMFGEPALHYPNYFYIMAPLYNQINIILSGLVGILLIGMATQFFASNYRSRQLTLTQSFKQTLPQYGLLLIIWTIETVFTLTLVGILPQVIIKILEPDYLTRRIIEMSGLFLGLLMASFFAFTTALIVLDKQSLKNAITQTFKICSKNGMTTFLLIAIPSSFYFPINFLLSKTPTLIPKFSPEIVILFLSIGILISFFTNYIQIGTITLLYLLVTKESRKY